VLADEPTSSVAAMLTETLEGLLRELQGRDRDILTLAVQGHTPAEISKELGRPERTVYRLLECIRKRLQQQGESDKD
jgi:DNA-directed RNA polymerase specialized sigma24 family protein